MVILWLLPMGVTGQVQFSTENRLTGYAVIKGNIYFVFDEKLYGIHPSKVVVEGSFRNWDHDMADQTWWLTKTEKGLWVLNSKQAIPPQAQFKFRIDNGTWVDPPSNAPNRKGDNMVFAYTAVPEIFRTEIVSPDYIRIIHAGLSGQPNLDASAYRLTDAKGLEIRVKEVFYIRPGELQIYPEHPLDIRKLYYLTDKRHKIESIVRFDGWFRTRYTPKKLGAFYDRERQQTIFRIFAPRATSVELYLYKEPDNPVYQTLDLVPANSGVWETSVGKDLNGIYYDYTIHGPAEPGDHFYETNPVHITDPYGQVSVDTWGPCRVWTDVTTPRPLKTGRPTMEDVIAYEVHVQDFTRYLPVDEKKKGTFTGFIERGLRNAQGEKIGFDHLLDLGVNVIHLMPVQEFLHYPDKAWQEAFINDPYMIEQGINKENYQWGYRTSHAMAIESRYREKGTEWGAQNAQFRDLVEAFHDAGIAVIVDLVVNHTAERMDGRMDYFNFSVLDMQYYYRTNANLDFIGAYGTETKSEERPMVQRWIIDQCKNLTGQYGVDGFRIDLAGQTDQQTLRKLRQALGSDIIIYGEPWIASADPDYEDNPDYDWYKDDAPITFFQDESRNAFKGPPSNPVDKWKNRGYAGGNGDREAVKKALSAGFESDKTPVSGINYLDIHDNWALADRFALRDWDGRQGVDENRVKIAAVLLFTSPGPVVIHGGTEFLRSKGHAPLVELRKKFQDGYIDIHGKRDTYNLAIPNAFIWSNKGKIPGDDNDSIHCNYKNMYAYWRGLIHLRSSEKGKIFRISQKPSPDYYAWIEPQNPRLLGYIVNRKMLVVLNTDSVAGEFKSITLPAGHWKLIGNTDRIDYIDGIPNEPDSFLEGDQSYDMVLEPAEIKIWYGED